MFNLRYSGGCASLAVKGCTPSVGTTNTEKVQEQVTVAFLRILELFIANDKSSYCGSDVMRFLNLPSGTVYPLLTRMTNAGWLNRELENVNPKLVGRPAKRFYQISSTGLKEGKRLISSQKVPITADAIIGDMEVAESC